MFVPVRRALLACGVIVLAAFLHGCNFLEDNGTHLAYALEKGAGKLRASGAQEMVVRLRDARWPRPGLLRRDHAVA